MQTTPGIISTPADFDPGPTIPPGSIPVVRCATVPTLREALCYVRGIRWHAETVSGEAPALFYQQDPDGFHVYIEAENEEEAARWIVPADFGPHFDDAHHC